MFYLCENGNRRTRPVDAVPGVSVTKFKRKFCFLSPLPPFTDLAAETTATSAQTTVIVSSGSSSGSTPSDLPPLVIYRPQRPLDNDNDDDADDDVMHAASAAHHHHHQQLSAPTTNSYDNNMIAGGYAYCNSPYDPYYTQTFAPLPPYTGKHTHHIYIFSRSA